MAKPRYLLSLVTKENDFQREQAAAAETISASFGVAVEVLFADNDPILQSQQLLDILRSARSADFQAVILEPAGGTSMTHIARAAIQAGLGWVLLNREIESIAELRKIAKAPVFAVSSDNQEVGRIQAAQIAALLPRGGTVLSVQGPSASQPAQRRTAGLQEAKPYNVAVKMLRCTRWTESAGYEAVAAWLRLMAASKEPIDLVAGQNDLLAMGARKALRESLTDANDERWSRVRYLGVNGLPDTGLAWVRNGTLAATVVVPPNTVPALNMLLQAERTATQPPELTLVAPYSFPEVAQLSLQAAARP